jgi:hypothetical protein
MVSRAVLVNVRPAIAPDRICMLVGMTLTPYQSFEAAHAHSRVRADRIEDGVGSAGGRRATTHVFPRLLAITEGGPVVNTLISANQFVYIKTPIRYTQRTLCIPEYTQTVPRGRLCDTHDPQQMLCDITCTFVSHKNGSATPATDNDRTRPAAGPAGEG